ncbi:basic salivary proline-rich protein 1-like [Lutra lutra]|uniref:basic salivary proline-rich protein 1-like n=1 Tax=Lutra lutra TaxID=9657 RepID=UPI001FD0E49B|nr:basic salivary proline-rich protein 1-like [Lutra lutra]
MSTLPPKSFGARGDGDTPNSQPRPGETVHKSQSLQPGTPMGKPVPAGRRRHGSQAGRASKKLRNDSKEGQGMREGGAGNSLRAQSLVPLLVAQGGDWKPTMPPRSVKGAAPWTWDVPQGVGPPQAKFVTSSLSSPAGSPDEGPVRDLPEEPGETLEPGGPRQGLGPDSRLQRSENRSPTRHTLTCPEEEVTTRERSPEGKASEAEAGAGGRTSKQPIQGDTGEPYGDYGAPTGFPRGTMSKNSQKSDLAFGPLALSNAGKHDGSQALSLLPASTSRGRPGRPQERSSGPTATVPSVDCRQEA